ncbi:MAG: hypothetical protein K9G76_03270 [Bacteroidales bacterium]|nr:hypothetical protein [Bacteroidales bacterium]MCF8402813.1 hypothetical protein [Bacteroidales bacterium]
MKNTFKFIGFSNTYPFLAFMEYGNPAYPGIKLRTFLILYAFQINYFFLFRPLNQDFGFSELIKVKKYLKTGFLFLRLMDDTINGLVEMGDT